MPKRNATKNHIYGYIEDVETEINLGVHELMGVSDHDRNWPGSGRDVDSLSQKQYGRYLWDMHISTTWLHQSVH